MEHITWNIAWGILVRPINCKHFTRVYFRNQFGVINLQFAVIILQFAVISLQFAMIILQNFHLLWNDP